MSLLPEIPVALAYWIFGAFGLTFGSFFNVLIYRVPRDLPIAFPPSHCPRCEARIRPWHNIPVLGWLMLGGRCKDCHGLISIQYPLVELLCGGLAVLAVHFANPDVSAGLDWARTLPLFWMMITLVPIAAVDFPYQLIPDTVSVGGFLIGFGVSWFPGGITWQQSLLGAAIAGGALWLFGFVMSKVLKRDAMGFGDVKLLASFGAIMGAANALAAVALASFLALAVMVPWKFVRKESQQEPLAFGPFIGLMGPVMFVWGDQMITSYMDLFRF